MNVQTHSIQSILFPRDNFDQPTARKWLETHNIHPIKLHITAKYMRYRIEMPKVISKYYSQKLPSGVILIIH